MSDRAIALDRVRREFADGPGSRVLGASLDYGDRGVARVRLPFRDVWIDERGDVASGIIALLAETAARLAALSLSPHARVRLLDIKLNHFGCENASMLAIGEVVLREATLAICRIEVLQKQDRTVALGLATYSLSEL
jgi:uncharacterized protein (TIGR00369 family)